MRLTRGTEYGTRGIVRLARMAEHGVVLVGDIALAEGLPESYLAKIFQDLAKEGIVRSHRGAKGGFSLARPAVDITLRQIIEAIEGPIALNRCLAPAEECEHKPECAIYCALAKAQEQLVAVLDGTTLQDLATGQPALFISPLPLK